MNVLDNCGIKDPESSLIELKKILSAGYQEAAVIKTAMLHNYLGDWKETIKLSDEYAEQIDINNIFIRNILLNEKEIAQKKLVLSSRPRSLTVTLNNKCNLDCIMCEAEDTIWEMPVERLKEIVGYFPYLESVMWQGGEVLMFEGFRDVLKEAKKYPHMRQIITSNGILLDKDMADELAAQPDLVFTFSIDAVKKEIYENIRKGALFEKLIENIEMMTAARKSKKSLMKLNLNVTVMKSNYRHLAEILDFAKRYEFDQIFLNAVRGDKSKGENIFLTNDREAQEYLALTIPEVESRAKHYGILLNNWLPLNARGLQQNAANSPAKAGSEAGNGYICHAPWQKIFVEWNGNVIPDCPCFQKTAVGNLRQHSILELWNCEKMQEYRRRIIADDYLSLCNPNCISGAVPLYHRKFNR